MDDNATDGNLHKLFGEMSTRQYTSFGAGSISTVDTIRGTVVAYTDSWVFFYTLLSHPHLSAVALELSTYLS